MALQNEDGEKFLKEFLKDAWIRTKASAIEGGNAVLIGSLDRDDYEVNPENPYFVEPTQLRGLASKLYDYFEQKGLNPGIQRCDSCGNCEVHKNWGYLLFISWK